MKTYNRGGAYFSVYITFQGWKDGKVGIKNINSKYDRPLYQRPSHHSLLCLHLNKLLKALISYCPFTCEINSSLTHPLPAVYTECRQSHFTVRNTISSTKSSGAPTLPEFSLLFFSGHSYRWVS